MFWSLFMKISRRFFPLAAIAALSFSGWVAQAQSPVSLLNVSYDPTRELYAEFNQSRHATA